MIKLPTLQLTLRPPTSSDAADIARLLGDWDVARMLALPPWPYLASDARAFVKAVRARTENDPAETVVIADKTSDRLLGIIDVTPSTGTGLPVLGYWLGKPYWGRGLMTEAARAVVGHVFASRCSDRILSGVFHDNPASLRVQEKLGFEVSGESLVFCRPRGTQVRHIDTALTRTTFESKPT